MQAINDEYNDLVLKYKKIPTLEAFKIMTLLVIYIYVEREIQ